MENFMSCSLSVAMSCSLSVANAKQKQFCQPNWASVAAGTAENLKLPAKKYT